MSNIDKEFVKEYGPKETKDEQELERRLDELHSKIVELSNQIDLINVLTDRAKRFREEAVRLDQEIAILNEIRNKEALQQLKKILQYEQENKSPKV
jgi:hypothetical protein